MKPKILFFIFLILATSKANAGYYTGDFTSGDFVYGFYSDGESIENKTEVFVFKYIGNDANVTVPSLLIIPIMA